MLEALIFSTGMVGYAYIEALNPGLTRNNYETLRPSNEIMYNRSVFSQPNATYQINSWIPQARLSTHVLPCSCFLFMAGPCCNLTAVWHLRSESCWS